MREVRSLGDMKAVVADVEATIMAQKGAKYLQAVYEREGVSQLEEGSMQHFMAKVAALTTESARIEGERDAAAALTRATPAQPQPSTPSNARMDHAAAVKHYEGLIAAGKSLEAGQFWQQNRELLMRPGGDRAGSREEALAKYSDLIKAGRSFEAGNYFSANRDLLRS
jgi:hypothetical protein